MQRLTGKTVTLTPSKNLLIERIADRALKYLEDEETFALSPTNMLEVLGGWNEILSQQRSDPKSTGPQAKLLEEKLTNLFNKSIGNQKVIVKLQNVARNSLLAQADHYLTAYDKIHKALSDRDEAALKTWIESPEIPLTSALAEDGDTLLHRLLEKEMYPLAELLIKQCPQALDMPNHRYELPFSNERRKIIEAEGYLTSILEEMRRGLKWCQKNPAWAVEHPNRVMLMIQEAMEAGEDDSLVCAYMREFPAAVQGQRGRNLLCLAIQLGSMKLVQQLLDLGVSPIGMYGEPLSWSKRKFADPSATPLHQAVSCGYEELVAFLLKQGSKVDARNGQGMTVVDFVTKTGKLSGRFPFPRPEVYRLIEAQLAPTERESFRQAIFQHAVAVQNWPEVARLLKEGLLPKGDVEKWAVEALKQGQYDLIQLLVEKGYVQQIPLEAIGSEITRAPLAWTGWFLTQMVQNGVDVNETFAQPRTTLLEIALKKQSYPLAALLISLGADPSQAGEAQAGLVHYALQLKQGPAALQGLKGLINAKNIAHLVGDPIIDQMKGDDGEKLEGNVSSASIAFFSQLLRAHPAAQASGPLHRLCQSMQAAYALALRIEALNGLKHAEHVATGIRNLEEELLAQIEQLPVGEALVVPAGWHTGSEGTPSWLSASAFQTNSWRSM